MCGIVGMLYKNLPAAPDLYVALMAMQHRGKEGARIVVSNNGQLVERGGMGEVSQAFWSEKVEDMPGNIGIGHVRYSTAGESNPENIQPIKGNFRGFDFYIAHNGNLVNMRELKKISANKENCSDTRVIADLISKSDKKDFEEALIEVLNKLKGSFNLILMFNETLYAAKDPFGFHPLQLGIKPEGFIIASESCVFDHLGAQFIRDIKPGEFLIIKKYARSYEWHKETSLRTDIFEFIYFLRPDSYFHGVESGKARYFMGRACAKLHQISGDIVIPVPDSGNEAARGFYEEKLENGDNVKFSPWALFRPHTVSRVFIEPIKNLRKKYLCLKFNPRPEEINGKDVILIDDSLVRSDTIKEVSKILKKAGARKINVIIASPMYLYPDFYGIDTYRVRDEIIAKRLNGNIGAMIDEISDEGGEINYLGYLDLDSTISSVLTAGLGRTKLTPENFYTGPFTGDYPAGTGDFEI